MAQERQYQLDTMRAVGLVIVVFMHTRVRGNIFGDLGPFALAMFFVLSGFLITGILLDARHRATVANVGRGSVLVRFYVRRFLRIFPLYYGVLFAAALAGEPITRQYFWELVTYRANFLMARVGHNIAPITPLWSLSVEEHFYAFWPLIVLFLSRRGIWISIAIMILGSVAARAWLVVHDAPYTAIAYPTYSAVDCIALGCALALAWRDSTADARRPWILRCLWIGATAELFRLTVHFIASEALTTDINRTLNTLPFALVCVWMVDAGARDTLPAWMRNRWLARLGLVSYGVYTMHRYVMHYLGYDARRGWTPFFGTLSVSIALATLSWLVYEGPINALKRYFPYVKRPKPARARAGSELLEPDSG